MLCGRSTRAALQLPGLMRAPRWTSAPKQPSQLPHATQPPPEPWSAPAPLSAPPAGHQLWIGVYCRASMDVLSAATVQRGCGCCDLPSRPHAHMRMQDRLCHRWRACVRQNRGYQLRPAALSAQRVMLQQGSPSRQPAQRGQHQPAPCTAQPPAPPWPCRQMLTGPCCTAHARSLKAIY